MRHWRNLGSFSVEKMLPTREKKKSPLNLGKLIQDIREGQVGLESVVSMIDSASGAAICRFSGCACGRTAWNKVV